MTEEVLTQLSIFFLGIGIGFILSSLYYLLFKGDNSA